jgi:hypothetical protein
LDERRIERAGQAAERRADGEGHQRVAPRVDAERSGAQRIFAQRDEGAAPGRTHQRAKGEGDERQRQQTQVVERQRLGGGKAEQARPRHAANAVDALRQPFFVAEDEKREG